jgi:hypothetical protein
MKLRKLLIIFFIGTISCKTQKTSVFQSQCIKSDSYTEENPIFSSVDEMPEFPKGAAEFSRFILKNLVYPKQDVYQGSINYSFIVDKEGNVSNIKIYNKQESKYTPLEKEAIKVLQLSPKWSAGKCGGKNVSVNVIIPLKFSN